MKKVLNNITLQMRRFSKSVSFYISIICLIIFFSPFLTNLFQYDKELVLNGELWRLFTSHLTHFSYSHLFWDLSVFFILGILCEQKNKILYIKCLIISSISISLFILFIRVDLEIYRGLSGIDSALFALLSSQLLTQKIKERDKKQVLFISIIIISFFLKIIYEVINIKTIFVNTSIHNFIPIPEAHIIGFIIGIIIILRYFPSRNHIK